MLISSSKMLSRLKAVSQTLSLPAGAGVREQITPLKESCLFADVSKEAGREKRIAVNVWNVGGGSFRLSDVKLEATGKKWAKLPEKRRGSSITWQNGPVRIVLDVDRRRPHSGVRRARLTFKSDAALRWSDELQISVEYPELEGVSLEVDRDLTDVGEVSLLELTIREADISRSVWLGGNFGDHRPQDIRIIAYHDRKLDVSVRSEKAEGIYHVDLKGDTRVFLPDSGSASLGCNPTFRIRNLGSKAFEGRIRTAATWVEDAEISVPGRTEKSIPLNIDLSALGVGDHFYALEVFSKEDDASPCLCLGLYVRGTVRGMAEIMIPEENGQIEDDSRWAIQWLDAMPEEVEFPKFLDFGDLPLFQEVVIHFEDELAYRVYLVGDLSSWNDGRGALMRRTEKDRFSVSVSAPDGEHFYRFAVDGEERLDPKRAASFVVGDHGVCSRLTLDRYRRTLEIKNQGVERFEATLTPDVDWLRVDRPELSIPPYESAVVEVAIDPARMDLGRRTGHLNLMQPGSRPMNAVQVRATFYVDSLVPDVRDPIHLGEFPKGERVRLPVKLDLFGQGELQVTVRAGKLIHEAFTLRNTGRWHIGHFHTELTLDTRALPVTMSKGLDVFVIAPECQLWNRRVTRIHYRYDIIQPRFSVPFLSFPRVFFNDPQPVIAEVGLMGDREAPDVSNISVVEGPPYLSVAPKDQRRWEMRLDATAISPGRHMDRLHVQDQAHGTEDFVYSIVEVVASDIRVVSETEPKIIIRPSRDKIEFRIENVGDALLKIYDVSTERGLFLCEPRIQQTVLAPRDVRTFELVCIQRARLFRASYVEDRLIVSSNSREPVAPIPIRAYLVSRIRRWLFAFR